MKYKAILFDLDGTLLDTLEDMADALNRTMDHFALPHRSLREVRSFVGNGARRLVELATGAEGERLEEIEKKPAKRWDVVITGALSAIVGALMAALMSGMIQ